MSSIGRDEDRPDISGFMVTVGPPMLFGETQIEHVAFYETFPGGLDNYPARELQQSYLDKGVMVSTRTYATAT